MQQSVVTARSDCAPAAECVQSKTPDLKGILVAGKLSHCSEVLAGLLFSAVTLNSFYKIV